MAAGSSGAVKALITITDRGRGSSLSAFFNRRYPQINILTMGVGTASSEIMALLGLDSADKDVVLSLVRADALPAMMAELSGKRFMKAAGKGIAFSLRLTGISSLCQAALSQTDDNPEGGTIPMSTQDNYSLILVVAEPGHTDKIAETARQAGATGGTILYGRGVGRDTASRFLGISIQGEREIVAILSPADQRLAIMKAVNSGFGIRTEAKAIVLSLPVEDMVQVG